MTKQTIIVVIGSLRVNEHIMFWLGISYYRRFVSVFFISNIYSPALKKEGYTGFAMSFRDFVIPWLRDSAIP